ncbi:hypothetical protein AB0M54_10505 [Actinoplanes sp. NPDC051470]|uniref:hypothetical protein n=1 Tax=Actinoplanes sp. NPDC051470 TaxID=3157224 RepID=UPI003428AEBC
MTTMYVDSWDPSYGAAFEGDGGDGPASPSTAQVETHHEVPDDQWAPIDPDRGARRPAVVLLVDGVRRNDALLWTREEDGTSYAGLAASYGAGVVRCDLANGVATLLPGARVGRGLFTASPSASDVQAGSVSYTVRRISGAGEVSKLPAAVQAPLTELEIEISSAAREDDDLLVVDGPLRSRRQLPRTVGYVKTQQRQYLSAQLTGVVTSLLPGRRTPLFKLGSMWGAWTWYLRLPGGSGAPWGGIVRLECSPDLTVEEAIELADVAAVTVPRFASSAYKDPRAPQNLIPIAGLERRLRGMLGDARVLHRALALSTADGRR